MSGVLPQRARQAVFIRAGEAILDEIAIDQPHDGDVLMSVIRVGICATDLHLFDGDLGDPYPLVPGHEFVGEVAALGRGAANNRGLRVGDRISVEMLLPCGRCPRCREGRYNICDRDDAALNEGVGRQYGINVSRNVPPGLWGGYSEFLTVPPHAIVHRVPKSISWDVAALIEPLSVAFHSVQRARVTGGENVVVIGPGPVGLLIAAAARISGADRVTVIGTRNNRLQLAKSFGADSVINIRDAGDVRSAVRRQMGGFLPDVVFEAAGTTDAQATAIDLVRRGGCVVLAGACGGGAQLVVHPDEQLLTREIDILPSFLSSAGYGPAILALERGEFPFEDLITHKFSLDDVVAALDAVRDRDADVMKAVLIPHA